MKEIVLLTDREIAALEYEHLVSAECRYGTPCSMCGTTWPCPITRLITTLKAAQEEVQRLKNANPPCPRIHPMDKLVPGTMTLQQLQERVYEWSLRNFGDIHASPSYRPLLGVQEEVGELSHAHLKGEQGIRHTPEEILEKKVDAVGDILIYLADYCAREGIFMQVAMEKTWGKVAQRDWKSNPMNAAEGGGE